MIERVYKKHMRTDGTQHKNVEGRILTVCGNWVLEENLFSDAASITCFFCNKINKEDLKNEVKK